MGLSLWMLLGLVACHPDKGAPPTDTDAPSSDTELPLSCERNLHGRHPMVGFSMWYSDGTIVGPDLFGRVNMASVGTFDLDGDGRDDLAVGASHATLMEHSVPGDWPHGAAYVVDDSEILSCVAAAEVTAQICNDRVGDQLGSALVGLPDVNGDGYDELLVAAGAEDYDNRDELADYGAYLFHGPVSGRVEAATADARIILPSVEGLGQAIASVGDLDLDGIADFAISAKYFDSVPDWAGGAVFLLSQSVTGDVDLPNTGIEIDGSRDAYDLGMAVAGGMDLNGDGLVDLIVTGSHNDRTGAFVVQGPVTASANIADVTTAVLWSDERPDGPSFRPNIGSVSGGGDIDQDGLDDLLVAVPQDSEVADAAGAVYVVHGPVTGGSTLISERGEKILGMGECDQFGESVSGGHDVDGDGVPDFIVGAPTNDWDCEPRRGTAWLVTRPVSGVVSVADVGFAIPGGAVRSSASVALGGDYDGDGLTDVLISDEYASYGVDPYDYYGAVHVFRASTLLEFMALQGW